MTRAAAAVTLAALGLLVGCSGGGATSSATGPPGPGPASPSTSSSSSSSSTLPPATAAQKAVPAEQNPPGDIPDNLAFVPYRNSAGRYAFTHPEGWAETTRGSSVTFTDKLNGVQVVPVGAGGPTTVDSARSADAPRLARTQAAFELRTVEAARVQGGAGVRIVYRRNSAPDPVTGRQYRDEVERYELSQGGRQVVVELFGPVGADNVDAYRTMIDSLRF